MPPGLASAGGPWSVLLVQEADNIREQLGREQRFLLMLLAVVAAEHERGLAGAVVGRYRRSSDGECFVHGHLPTTAVHGREGTFETEVLRSSVVGGGRKEAAGVVR